MKSIELYIEFVRSLSRSLIPIQIIAPDDLAALQRLSVSGLGTKIDSSTNFLDFLYQLSGGFASITQFG